MSQPRSLGRVASAWAALRGRQELREPTINELLMAQRGYGGPISTGGVHVDESTALRHSAVWAALRLRANLESSLPVDCFVSTAQGRVEEPLPDVLLEPWPGVTGREWRYGSRYDLDRSGNTFGVIRATGPRGLPTQIEPVSIDEVSALCRGRQLREIRVNGELIPAELVWHERQYAPAGFVLGMSPIQAARHSIGGYLAAQQFGLSWFEQDGAHPTGVLRNTVMEELAPGMAEAAKRKFKESTRGRDIFVTGKDWEWTAEAVTADSAGFLAQMQWGAQDVARFLDVPGDMIDAGMSGSSVTYANITQRNLQFLITAMGPAIARREDSWRRLCPAPAYVKLNTDALLRMDPDTRWKVHGNAVRNGLRSVNEVRAIEDLPSIGPDGDRFLWPPLRMQLDAVEYEGGSNATWEAPQ